MKKYKILYVIIYLLLLALVFTGGINIEIKEKSYDDYYDKGIIDGFAGSSVVYVYNFIIVIILFISSLIITLTKNNKIKYKNLIFVGILILLLFIPVYMMHRSGGIAGINEKTYANILRIPIKIINN